nr:Uncharacterised protein [Klebsiella pneumoniae]
MRTSKTRREMACTTLSCASPRYMAMTHRLPVDGVVEAVIAGVQEGCRDFVSTPG